VAALFTKQPEAFQTQYAEVRERARAAGPILPGTPGSLALKRGTGYGYWYRVYYSPPGKKREDLVGKASDEDAKRAMEDRIAFAGWMQQQVPLLRKLGYQVADKTTALVLAELHNRGTFEAGLILVGTLAHMAWLNEFGATVTSARTMDIGVARMEHLSLGAPLSFLDTLKATGLPFSPVPGLGREPPTSAKLRGADGLRVDLLVPGKELWAAVPVPELDFAAQTMPYYEYLLRDPENAVVLAGWQCIPVRIPQAARMMWHKLYSSVSRREQSKSGKDFRQAAVLAALISENDPHAIANAFDVAPKSMISAIRPRLSRLLEVLQDHPEAAAAIEGCLVEARKARKTGGVRR
jgi:hypothetical protein